MIYAEIACRGLVGLVFAVSAFAKLRSPGAYREFASWLETLPAPLARKRALPAVFIGTEAAIVVLIALPGVAMAGLALAAGCLTVMIAVTVTIINQGARISCWCFGPTGSSLSARHIVRDSILLLISVAGVATGALVASQHPPSTAGIALSLAAALLSATVLVFIDDLIAVVSINPATRPSKTSER